MSLWKKFFGKQPAADAPRKRACVQCGAALPEHANWCPVASEARAAEKQSA